MTSQAMRSVDLGEARIEPGEVDGVEPVRRRAPSARSTPAPPSVVALPPIPSDDVADRPRRGPPAAARRSRASSRPIGSRSSAATQRQPGRLGQLDDGLGRRPPSEPAGLDGPPERVVDASPSATASRRPPRSRRACPRRRRRAGRGAARSSGRARAPAVGERARRPRREVSEPLNESGAKRTVARSCRSPQGRLDDRASTSRAGQPRGARGTRGCGPSAGAPGRPAR